MTSPSDLVAPNLIARIAVAIAAGKTIENNWPVTLMQECWDAIEQLQAELAEARDAGIVLKEERESALESARFWEKEESRIHSAMPGEHDALRLQLSRAREWMRHKPECLIAKGYDKYAPRTITIDLQGASVTTQHHGVYIGSDDAPKGNCTCGLQGFLKEVGE